MAAGVACIPEGRKVFPNLTAWRLSGDLDRRDTRTHDGDFQIFPLLAERRLQLADTMSGGEQAMVSIGHGLTRAPKLLLIDEPSFGLSPRLVKENFNIIRDINQRGIAVFLVEQNVHQTLAISHFGHVLSKGRVVASGTSSGLAKNDQVREAYFS